MRPETENELAECVAGAKGPVSVRGGNTRGFAGPGEELSLAGLSGIELYEPGALTLVAKAGTPVAEIEAALAVEGQRLAFEPMDARGLMGRSGEPTIGGVVAANASGPRRIAVGACRDFLLGVRFVDGRGTVLKNGGRVMKNVTGYDLVKLMAGSFGTLGVMSEVSLKVLPAVEARACVLINGLSDKDAIAVMSRALGSPFEVTGAAHFPSGMDGHPVTMIRVEGFEASVAYRAEKLRDLLAGIGAGEIESDQTRVAAGWAYVRDVELFHGTGRDVWRVSVKPSDGPGFVSALPDGCRAMYDWGGGLIWVESDAGTDIRAALAGIGGHATLVRGEGVRFQPENPVLARISAELCEKFDPRGILNAGLMG